MMRAKSAAAPRLELALYKWICSVGNDGVLLNADIVKIKGQKFLETGNKMLSDDNRIELTFLKDWIDWFKKRYCLRFRRLHGEGMSAESEGVELQVPRIKHIIIIFAPRDIWNTDKSCLFYRKPPRLTLLNAGVPGNKKDKYCITSHSCRAQVGKGQKTVNSRWSSPH